MTRRRLQPLALLLAVLLGLALPAPAAPRLLARPHPAPAQFSPHVPSGAAARTSRRGHADVPAAVGGDRDVSPLEVSCGGVGGESSALPGASSVPEWGRAAAPVPAALSALPAPGTRFAAGPSSPRAPPAVSR